jgi:hypothetical protein
MQGPLRFSTTSAPRRGPVTFEQSPDGSVTLQPSDMPTWQQYLTDFDKAVSMVQQKVAELGDMKPPQDPLGYQTWWQLLQDGQKWLAKLQHLQSTRDSVASWASGLYSGAVDVVSRDVIEPIANLFHGAPPARGLGALGIAPLVIAGVGLAAFAAAVYGALKWADTVTRFLELDRIARAQMAQGINPQAAYANAAALVRGTAGGPDSPGILEQLGSKVIWAGAIVLIAIFVLPKLLPAGHGRE